MDSSQAQQQAVNPQAQNTQTTPTPYYCNNYAIAGLLLSLVVPAAGLTLSIIGLQESKKTGCGRAWAIWGIVLSCAIFVIICVIIILLLVGLFAATADQLGG